MEQLAAHLPHQYMTLAKDSKQSEVGKQFSEFIKLQQTTSKKTAPKRFSFEIYRAEERWVEPRRYINFIRLYQGKDGNTRLKCTDGYRIYFVFFFTACCFVVRM